MESSALGENVLLTDQTCPEAEQLASGISNTKATREIPVTRVFLHPAHGYLIYEQ